MTTPPLDGLTTDGAAALLKAAVPDLPIRSVAILRQNSDWLVVEVHDR